MKYTLHILIIIFTSIVSFTSISAQLTSYKNNPLEAEIVYTDVENFIRAEKLLSNSSDTLEIFQREYIDKGTPGLKIFIEKYSLTAEKLAKAYKKNIDDYKSLPKKLNWLKSQEDSIRQYFVKLNHFIPQAVFPPTYYLIDIRRGIGSGSIEGQLITIEKEAKNIIDPLYKACNRTEEARDLPFLKYIYAKKKPQIP